MCSVGEAPGTCLGTPDIDQNHFLYQAVNISAVKLGILTWGVYGTDSLLEPTSSGQSMNCSLSHFRVGFKMETGRLPLVPVIMEFQYGSRSKSINCTHFQWSKTKCGSLCKNMIIIFF